VLYSFKIRNYFRTVAVKYFSSLLAIFLLSMIIMLIGVSGITIDSDPVVGEAPSLIGFSEDKDNVFRTIKEKNKFHQIATFIPLVPNTYYQIQYDIPRLSHEKISLITDLYAPGYDNAKQEYVTVLGMNELGKRQNILLHSGKSPEYAHLRLFYTGLPGLEIKNIQIMQVATWSVWLKRGLLTVSISMMVLVMLTLLIKQVSNLSLISNSTEANRLRILSTEWLAVLAIYFFAVLIRYAIFIVTPYWSGDEFVYKTIASGIWQYGQHGVLTDTQISHSVDIPNLLYPYLISPAFILGENFYFGIRFINSIVINMAIFPCYLIARKFLTRNNAIVASTIALAIPFINIGAFAVTEVLFFPLFLLSVWIAKVRPNFRTAT